MAAGCQHSLSIHADGTRWAWGDNSYGQLGLGTTTDQATPQPVGTAAWRSVAAGQTHTLAVRQDGILWAWGSNAVGQLGTGPLSTAVQPVPGQVGTLATWQSAVAGGSVAGALRTDGSLWLWGYNGFGQLTQPFTVLAPLYIPNGGALLAAAGATAASPWQLAPNPARGQQQVQLLGAPAASALTLNLFDAQGRLVRSATGPALPTQGLAPGLYLLQAAVVGQPPRTLRLAVE